MQKIAGAGMAVTPVLAVGYGAGRGRGTVPPADVQKKADGGFLRLSSRVVGSRWFLSVAIHKFKGFVSRGAVACRDAGGPKHR